MQSIRTVAALSAERIKAVIQAQSDSTYKFMNYVNNQESQRPGSVFMGSTFTTQEYGQPADGNKTQ